MPFIKEKRFSIILAKKDRFQSFIFIFVLFSIYIFVFSESGLLERTKLKNKFYTLNNNIDVLKLKNSKLYNTYKNYTRGIYTPDDFIKSGYIPSDGIILNYRNDEQDKLNQPVIENGLFQVNLSHLRIIWIMISVMAAVFYFSRQKSGDQLSDE